MNQEMTPGCLPGTVLDAFEILKMRVSDPEHNPRLQVYWLKFGGWSLSELVRNSVVCGTPLTIDPSDEWPESYALAGWYGFQFMDEESERQSVEESPPAVLALTLCVSLKINQGVHPLIRGVKILCKERHRQYRDLRFCINGEAVRTSVAQPFSPGWVGMNHEGLWLRHWRVS